MANARALVALAVAAGIGIVLMTREAGDGALGTNGRGLSSSDIEDLRSLNETSPSGFQAGNRAGRVETGRNSTGDGSTGFIGL